MNEQTRAQLQADIDANRRSERRLIRIAIVALAAVAVLVLVRLVYFS